MLWRRSDWLPAMAGGLLLLLLGGAGGCQRGDLADRQLHVRSQQLARTAGAAVEAERCRPELLARTARETDQCVHWHVQATRGNVDELERYWQGEWQRWLERQPVYQREARRILRGEPERIESHAILMFF